MRVTDEMLDAAWDALLASDAHPHEFPSREQVRAAIEAALAAAPQPRGEPVAFSDHFAPVFDAIVGNVAPLVRDGALLAAAHAYVTWPAPPAQPSADPWRDAVDQMLLTTEQTASDDPRESLNRLIDWHVSVAMDPLVSSDAKALIQRGRDDAQPSAEPSKLVRAARDALAAMIDGLTPVEDGRPHHMVMEYKRALDALRRALDAGDGAGEARDARPPCGLPGTLRCGLRELAINPPRNPPLWTCDNPNCSRMPRAQDRRRDAMQVTDAMIAAAQSAHRRMLDKSAWMPADEMRAVLEAALAAAPQGEPVAFHELLREAEAEVREKPVWKRYIDGTPLANDVPVWMAVFAQHHARAAAPSAPAAQPSAAMAVQPVSDERVAAYDLIDRYLRNNLDDTDYAEYSASLDTAFGYPVGHPGGPSDE